MRHQLAFTARRRFAVALKALSTSEDRPDVMNDDYLVSLYKAADLDLYSEKDIKDYKNAIMNSWEYEATLYDYREEGKKEGILETARNMKANDIPLATIAQCTGLDKEALAKL